MAEQSVTYSLAIKRSMRDYQNYTPFYSVTETVREDETVDEAFDRLEEIVEKRMDVKIKQLDKEL